MHRAGHDVPLPVTEFFVHKVALGFTQSLHHDLLSRLRGDPAKITRSDFHFHHVTNLGGRIPLLRLGQRDLRVLILHRFDDGADLIRPHLTRVAIDLDAHVLRRGAVVLLIGREQRGLDGLDDDLFADALLFLDLLEGLHQFNVHPAHLITSSRVQVGAEVVHLYQQPGLSDLALGKMHLPAVQLEDDRFPDDTQEDPPEVALAIHRSVRLELRLFAGEAAEVGVVPQRPIQSRGGHFQCVGVLEQVVEVQLTAEET